MIGTCLPDFVSTTVAGTPFASIQVIDEASAELAFAELLDNASEPATTRRVVIEIIPFGCFVWALYTNLFVLL